MLHHKEKSDYPPFVAEKCLSSKIAGYQHSVGCPGAHGAHPEVESSGIAYHYVFMALGGGLGLIKGFLYAGVLGDEAMGYYALAILIANYTEPFSHFGLYRGLECFLPSLYGAGKYVEVERLRNQVAGFILLLTIGFFVLTSIAVAFHPSENLGIKAATLMAGCIAASSLFFSFAAQDLRSRKSTVLHSIIIFAKFAAQLTLGVAAAYRYGYMGILITESAVNIFIFALMAKFWCRNFRFDFSGLFKLRNVFRVGIPLTLKNTISSLALHLDRWCVLFLFGVAAFGQYAFAMLLVSGGLLLQNIITSHVGPHIIYAFGQRPDLRPSLHYLYRASLCIILVFALSWLPFNYMINNLLPLYFPEYSEGTKLLPVFYWGTLFQVLSQYEWIPMAVKLTDVLLCMTLATTVLIGLMYGVGVLFEWSMVAFAWIFVAGRGISALGGFVTAMVVARRNHALTYADA